MLHTEKLKQLRERAGLSQEDAAVRAGLKSKQAWWNIESGQQSNITLETLDKIAGALKCKAKDLLK